MEQAQDRRWSARGRGRAGAAWSGGGGASAASAATEGTAGSDSRGSRGLARDAGAEASGEAALVATAYGGLGPAGAGESLGAVGRAAGAAGKGGGRGGRGGKAGKGGGFWGEGLPRTVRISKSLTQILRHKAPELGINIRPDGFCPAEEVLALSWLQELSCTRKDMEEVVQGSDKKRFETCEEDGVLLIRAVQGHSIKVVQDEQLLRRMSAEDDDLPPLCVHGTYRRYFDSIKAKGLLAGGGQGQGFRNHVHFAPFEPGDKRVISGMRYDCEVAIWIDLKKALEDGLPFYMSANQVILSPGIDGHIDIKYFLQAKDLKSGEILMPAVAPDTR